MNVTSPYTNKTYALARYAVKNTAPRPESYLTGKFSLLPKLTANLSILDYLTANDPTLTTPLNETQRSALYAELASGAESGIYFSPMLDKCLN